MDVNLLLMNIVILSEAYTSGSSVECPQIKESIQWHVLF